MAGVVDAGAFGRAGRQKHIVRFPRDSVIEGQRRAVEFGKFGFDLHDLIIAIRMSVTATDFGHGKVKPLLLDLTVRQPDPLRQTARLSLQRRRRCPILGGCLRPTGGIGASKIAATRSSIEAMTRSATATAPEQHPPVPIAIVERKKREQIYRYRAQLEAECE